MVPNPKTAKDLQKTLKVLIKNAPFIIDGIREILKRIRGRRKKLHETKPLEEGNIQATQEDWQKIDMCIKSLRQHVKVINRNSTALKEHTEIIEDVTAQSEDLAILVGAISSWIKVLIWTTGISLVLAVIAVLVAIFK